jgi:hypothetical protein
MKKWPEDWYPADSRNGSHLIQSNLAREFSLESQDKAELIFGLRAGGYLQPSPMVRL